jgi:hypothetical protein
MFWSMKRVEKSLGWGRSTSLKPSGTPDCHWSRQNWTLQFAKPECSISDVSSRGFWSLFISCTNTHWADHATMGDLSWWALHVTDPLNQVTVSPWSCGGPPCLDPTTGMNECYCSSLGLCWCCHQAHAVGPRRHRRHLKWVSRATLVLPVGTATTLHHRHGWSGRAAADAAMGAPWPTFPYFGSGLKARTGRPKQLGQLEASPNAQWVFYLFFQINLNPFKSSKFLNFVGISNECWKLSNHFWNLNSDILIRIKI